MSIKTQLLDLIRETTEVNYQQCSDALLLKFLNLVRNDIFAFASTFKGNHFTWNYWITDLIAGQAEYTLAEDNGETKYDMKKVISLYRKNSGDQREKIKSYDMEALPYALSELEQNGPDFYFRADTNSVFLYPIPTETIVDGLKVVGSYIPKDLKLSSTMEELLLPREYEALLWAGISIWIYKHKKQYQEMQIAQQEYENEKLKFKATSGEMQKIHYAIDSDLSDFE